MRFAGYVITGWAITGGVVASYWLSVRRRIRRAEASSPTDDRGPG